MNETKQMEESKQNKESETKNGSDKIEHEYADADGETSKTDEKATQSKDLKRKFEATTDVHDIEQGKFDHRGTLISTSSTELTTPPAKKLAGPTMQKPTTSTRSGGLASLVDSLNARSKKQSLLDKSANDWRQFVEQEDIEDELSTHLRGRDSFLDKQEFLLRADYSQFEKERDLRAQERKSKQMNGNKK